MVASSLLSHQIILNCHSSSVRCFLFFFLPVRCFLMFLKIKSQKVNNNYIVFGFFVPQEQANHPRFLLCLCLLPSDSKAAIVSLTTFSQKHRMFTSIYVPLRINQVVLLMWRKTLYLIWHCNQGMPALWRTRVSTSSSLQDNRTSLPELRQCLNSWTYHHQLPFGNTQSCRRGWKFPNCGSIVTGLQYEPTSPSSWKSVLACKLKSSVALLTFSTTKVCLCLSVFAGSTLFPATDAHKKLFCPNQNALKSWELKKEKREEKKESPVPVGAVPSPLEWPGTCFPTEKILKGSLSLSLFLSGWAVVILVLCSAFWENTQAFKRRKCSLFPPKREERKVFLMTQMLQSFFLIFKSNFPSVDSCVSSSHRSPRHVRHPPTMNWWVTCLKTPNTLIFWDFFLELLSCYTQGEKSSGRSCLQRVQRSWALTIRASFPPSFVLHFVSLD